MNEALLVDVSNQLTDTQTALNILWTMITGVLVMFMQAGFALVETGFSRAKNAAHTMAMNFLVYSIGVLGFWMIGFGLQMGGSEVASHGETTGRRLPSLRGSANARQAMSSWKMCAAPCPSPSRSAAPT